MADIILAWGVAPALLIVVSLGIGCALRVVGIRGASGPITAVLGFCGLILIGWLCVAPLDVPRLAIPAVVTVAIAGYAGWLASGGRLHRIDRWSTVAGLGAYAVYAAPILASGAATWAGWVKLDDGGSWLGFTDYLLTSGRTPPAELSSTFDRLISVNFPNYPVGVFPPLGISAALAGVDPAWVLQPYMALMAALLAVLVYRALEPVTSVRALRCAAAVVVVQAATLYGYVLWGGIKEVATALLVFTFAVAAAGIVRRGSTVGQRAAVAVVALALLTVIGRSGLGYLVPIAVVFAIAWFYERERISGRIVAILAGALAIAALLVVLIGRRGPIASLIPGMEGDMGNLIAPLSRLQMLGVWITGDFRFPPEHLWATRAAIAVVTVMALLGLIVAIRRRQWAVPFVFAASVGIALSAQETGGAWLAGKAIAIASPAVLAAAAVGVLWAIGSRRINLDFRLVAIGGVAAALVITGGVLWSNALAYHDVWLAPRAQLAELESIGEQFAGRGPAMIPEYSVYGARHFLRELDAEAASELRVNPISLRDGSLLQKGGAADIGAFPPASLERYNLLVLRRGPSASRPPYPYRLARAGEYYDVWERDPGRGKVLSDLTLDAPQPATAAADCSAIKHLADGAPEGATLVGVARAPVINVSFADAVLPAGWVPMADSGGVLPLGPGTASAPVAVPTAGRYDLWLAGSYPGSLKVYIDGRRVFAGHSMIESNAAMPNQIGSVDLTAGGHALEIAYTQPWYLPGSGAGPFPMGPIMLGRSSAATAEPIVVAASRPGRLCGLDLSRVEVVVP